MIMDSHAYAFEAADSLMGYDSVDEHLRWVQAGQASHYQPAFSLSDRSRGSSEVLAPGESGVLTGLPDVDFRIDHAAGRVVWTVDGEDYTKLWRDNQGEKRATIRMRIDVATRPRVT